MILSLTAIDKNAELREFFCQLTEIEEALDLLNFISSQGDRLIRAHIIDGESRLILPVEAFDGQPVRIAFKQLESQWGEALSEPVYSVKIYNSWRIDFANQRVRLYDNRIKQISCTIGQIERLRQRVEEIAVFEPYRTLLIDRYTMMINKYQQQIRQAQTGKQQLQKKLERLELDT